MHNSYAPLNVGVKDIGSWASMVLQNVLRYQNFIEMSANMIYIVALDVEVGWGGGLKKFLEIQ